VIRAHLATLPETPGVYRMLGEKGAVLYVGKAKALKRRVASYTRPEGLPLRLQRMIAETTAMEFIVTSTEHEALLLESNLIKKLEPRYNVLLRDDKMFPYIVIGKGHEYPQLFKHRGMKSALGEYYGPFASASAVNETLTALQRAFLLRSCSDSYFATRKRPCLLYQIKRCSAPCVGKIQADAYAELVREAKRFLTGKDSTARDDLAARMEAASAAMEYERAAIYRDRIRALSQIQARQDINTASLDDADVVAVATEGGRTCVQVFFIRQGRNYGNRAFYPRQTENSTLAEVLEGFVSQFYSEVACPPLILLSETLSEPALLAEALSQKSAFRVVLDTPRRGTRHAVVALALRNAAEVLARKLSEQTAQQKLLAGVAEVFGLSAPPRRIEVYDNSHIQGRHALGAMIVAGPEGFQKTAYRKFNMDDASLQPGDDFGMMRAMLERRFARLQREDADRTEGQWPDLLLIDGGAGQLAVVCAALEDLGLHDIPVVGIAKGPDRNAGRERFFLPGREPFSLPPDDPVLYYLQRLRDEAHRFVITGHRARRSKAAVKSPLDAVPGIGPTRKKALLAHFGSGKAVTGAALADLEAVPGISKAIAQRIYAYFHTA
jgi:excinuclease ABC subunit C